VTRAVGRPVLRAGEDRLPHAGHRVADAEHHPPSREEEPRRETCSSCIQAAQRARPRRWSGRAPDRVLEHAAAGSRERRDDIRRPVR
jgi:hypothetical protein